MGRTVRAHRDANCIFRNLSDELNTNRNLIILMMPYILIGMHPSTRYVYFWQPLLFTKQFLNIYIFKFKIVLYNVEKSYV